MRPCWRHCWQKKGPGKVLLCSLLRGCFLEYWCLGPILDRFWIDFGSLWAPKIAPKSIPRGFRMALEIIVVFESLQDPLKIDFSANMAATCPQLGPQHAPKLGPKWCRNRSRRPMGPHGPPWSPSESSLDRFGVDFDRFWVDFLLILGCFFVACWVHMSATICDIFGYSCGIST